MLGHNILAGTEYPLYQIQVLKIWVGNISILKTYAIDKHIALIIKTCYSGPVHKLQGNINTGFFVYTKSISLL